MLKIMKIPIFKQDTDYSCGPTVLQMIFAYFGIRTSENFLMHAAHTGKKDGTKHKWMIKVCTAHGLHAYVNEKTQLTKIEHFLEQKILVVVHYIEPEGNIGHYAIVTKISKTTITLNDPWFGKNFRMSKQSFVKRWHGEKQKHHNWIMAVSDKPFLTGKQYHPKRNDERPSGGNGR